MMTDLDTAILVIKAAAEAEEFNTSVLFHAIHLAPNLPWEMAARGLAEERPDDFRFAVFATSTI